jgi:tRNA (cytidine/uridine-2'-O-)-methyltransferase
LDHRLHRSWEHFLAGEQPGRLFVASTRGEKSLFDCRFAMGDYVVFGSESRGLPPEFYERYRANLFRIPMPGSHARSLNLANAVAIVLYEMYRQIVVAPQQVAGPDVSC